MNAVSVKAATARYFGVRPSKLDERALAYPAAVGMYVAHRVLGVSSTETGEAFNRDHATVLHAVRNIERNRDPVVRMAVLVIAREFAQPDQLRLPGV